MEEDAFDGTEQSPSPVIRANKTVRAAVIVVWIVAVLIGAAAIRWLLPYSEQYISKQEPQAALRTMQILCAIIFLSVLPPGVYLVWFGHRAVQGRQMPPPGAWVLRNTKVVEGSRAQRRGRIVMMLGVLLFVLGLFCALYFPYRLGTVFQSRPPQPSVESATPTEAR